MTTATTSDARTLLRELGYRPRARKQSLATGQGASSRPADAYPAAFGLEQVEELLAALERDPQGVLERARQAWDADLTEDQLRQSLVDAQVAFRAPKEATQALRAAKAQWFAGNRLPDTFTFPLRTDAIPIEPSRWRFETVRDVLGWIALCGPFVAGSAVAPKAPFRWHSDPVYPSNFVYALPDASDATPTRLALFGDFGTGEYQSRYIARQLEHSGFPYAIHLGDVYYAGRSSEFEEHFDSVVEPLLHTTKLFSLNANHEMYSGGGPYFDSMSRRKAAHSNQEQDGSYFVLRSSRHQIVGIDTAYFGHGRHAQPDLASWLESVLRDGRSSGRWNVLLSGDEPYTYGKTTSTALYDDLRRVASAGLIDLWFWGNTHYCALFDRSPAFPFLGSCIGHAGYPYGRVHRGKPEPAPVLFLETAARFPAWTKVRQDRGNNGYCVLELTAGGDVRLRYVDWMGNTRCTADVRGTPGAPLSVETKTFA
jgi:hypothetical protein